MFSGRLAIVALVLSPTQLFAADLKDGWSLSTKSDPFKKTISVFVSIGETASDQIAFDKAQIAFTCEDAVFQSTRFKFGNDSEAVSFRVGSEIFEAVFRPKETSIGTVFAADQQITNKLREGFLLGEPIGFQADKKTGEFAAIGAKEVFAALELLCGAKT